MNHIFAQLEEELQSGRSAVLLTVIDSRGATPRGAGSRQLVLQSGSVIGTIGGGIGEYKAGRAAEEALHTGLSRILKYDLSSQKAADIGAVCGGTMTVFCQVIRPDSLDCIRAVAAYCREQKPFILAYNITEPDKWGMAVMGDRMWLCGDEQHAEALRTYMQCEDRKPFPVGLHQYGSECIYCESVVAPGRVFVFGAGHVAHALVPVLASIGFLCTVIDDREDFANAVRFPDAAQVIVADLEHLPDLSIGNEDYVCIMTRGHVGDYAVERQVLPLHPHYIGVIGSRNKLAFVRNKLSNDGFTDRDFDAVYAPIGIPISAATPEEIAISIAAELIAVRARKEGREKADARKWKAADAPHIRMP